MKKVFTLIFFLFMLTLKADYWTQKAAFPGTARNFPFSFSIGSKGYVGTGANFDLGTVFFQDFWEYDPSANAWTQKADFGGGPREAAIGFSVNGKGYPGTGILNSGSSTDDFWEYDPSLNTWTQIADFGGGIRNGAASFNILSKGYVGTGYVFASTQDLWEYNPAGNIWTQKSSLTSFTRHDAVGFSLNNKGYIGCGYTQGNFLIDFWEYDPLTDTWAQKADFPGMARSDAASFAIGNKGYAGVGEGPAIGSDLNDFWQYDPVINQWIQKTTFPGIARDEPAYFSLGNKGYIGLGYHYGAAYFNDFWEYTPDSSTTIEEYLLTNLNFQISPNPAKELLIVSYSQALKEKIELTITDVHGKKVYSLLETRNTQSETKIDVSNFSKGIYFVELNNGKQKAVKNFVKE